MVGKTAAFTENWWFVTFLKKIISGLHVTVVSFLEKRLFLFLQSCYFSSERAKEAIETFFTIKTHSPEIFGVRDTKSDVIRETARVG